MSRSAGAAQGARTTEPLSGPPWRWIPLGVSLGLAGLGWHVHSTVGEAWKGELRKQLVTILEADLAALRLWSDGERRAAHAIAGGPELRAHVASLQTLVRAGPSGRDELLLSDAQREIRQSLEGQLGTHQFEGFLVVGPDGLHWASDRSELVGLSGLAEKGDFVARALAGETVLSRPFLSMVPLPDREGRRAAQRPTLFVATPLLGRDGTVAAVLALRIRPEEDFTRILSVARSGASGETYAFDAEGLMISQSRFDEQLREIGLLPDREDASSLLRVRIRDPGVNLLTGKRPERQRGERPLTRMAAAAVQGRDGVDVDGYRDYRGVPVIGAWAWLPEHGFGIATEVDVAEAYRPLRILRASFFVLFGLLVLASGAVVFFSRSILILRGRVRSAVLEAQRLGQYELEEWLGGGGLGDVYRASHVLLRRPTAVKILKPDRYSPEEIRRFGQEVVLTSRLSHPNTIRIYDYGITADGLFYFAMEYLPGAGLDRLVRLGGAQPEGRVIHLLLQVCASLQEAHALGLVHRDIKPANLILCERGGLHDFVVVADFGLAKDVRLEEAAGVTDPRFTVGTPRYLPPEAVQTQGVIDCRSDIYSLGAVAYFLLTGQELFDTDSVVEIIRRHLQEAPQPPSQRLGRPISADLEALVMSCLEKDPDRRPQSAKELAARLRLCREAATWTERLARRWWERYGDAMRRPETREGGARKRDLLRVERRGP